MLRGTRLLTHPWSVRPPSLGQRPAGPTQATHDQRADPLPRSITLEIPRDLLTSLRDLTTGVGGDDHAVGEFLQALVRELEKAVASYRGLQLTISQNGFPVVLTAYADGHDGAALTSLRVPLVLVGSGFATESRVVFYAGTSGAFVDLAADLTYAFDQAPRALGRAADHPTPPSIRLDADLPPGSRTFGLDGVAELSTINEAVGVLIDQGHDPDHAHEDLRGDAARAGLEPHAWAARLLLRTRTRRLE